MTSFHYDSTIMASAVTDGTIPIPQGVVGSSTIQRILCPVATCPEASTSSNKLFKDFNSIKNHLNDHCTGHLSGADPPDFLHFHNYSQHHNRLSHLLCHHSMTHVDMVDTHLVLEFEECPRKLTLGNMSEKGFQNAARWRYQAMSAF